MIKELYKLRLVILLAIIAISMGVVRLRYRNYQWTVPTETIEILPSLAPTLTPTSEPKAEVIYPLWSVLPYKGKNFEVDSYSGPLTLSVKTSGNIKTVTKEVHKWMLENKVATESHKLVFSSQ